MKTPILFLVFNRPETTFQVFQKIREQRPKQLFISADGPRQNKKGEIQLCNKVRSITKLVDWECELVTNFSDRNLGCKRAVAEGITWFFEHVEEGIILEDDCLPEKYFFSFCEQLLAKYRLDERVMMISGCNQLSKWNVPASYFFSSIGSVWGWASWKRAWSFYSDSIEAWNSCEEILFNNKSLFSSKREQRIKIDLFKKSFEGFIDAWGYIWDFHRLINNGLCIIPSNNLVENIGYGQLATHSKDNWFIPKEFTKTDNAYKLDKHPKAIFADREYDKIIFNSLHFPTITAKVQLLLKNRQIFSYLKAKIMLK